MKEREIALKVLLSMEKNQSYSNLELNRQLEKHDLPQREKNLTTRIVYGVLQNRTNLDHIIGTYSKLPLKKISPEVLNILRLGIYQLTKMDKVPDYAVVNESIRLTKKCRQASAGGFVNAVLRGSLRGDKTVVYPKAPLERWSIIYSVPDWICEMWQKVYGDETEALLTACNQPPPFTVRVNPLKGTVEAFIQKYGGCRSKFCDWGVVLEQGFSVAADSGFQEGLYLPQDQGSMLPAQALAPQEGQTVLDVCAAPGGKATQLAQLMGNEGIVYAFDIYPHKLELIRQAAERQGLTIIRPALQDASQYEPQYFEIADKVLVDAPCSGLGILRRKPEIKWVRKPEDIPALAKLQKDILHTCASYVKIGGELVYSTCTISPLENERQIEAFLESHPEFEPVEFYQDKSQLQLLPHRDGTDGFFIAKLRKTRRSV